MHLVNMHTRNSWRTENIRFFLDQWPTESYPPPGVEEESSMEVNSIMPFDMNIYMFNICCYCVKAKQKIGIEYCYF